MKKAKKPRVKTPEQQVEELQLAAKESVALATPDDSETEARILRAKRKYELKAKHQAVPEGLEGAAAEEWADKKLVDLLPAAVADVEWDLKYGDDAERQAARKQILDATGRGKREQGGGGSQPIIMLVGAGVGPGAQPWLQRVEPKKIDGGEK